jgi:hypothetical protein
MTLKLTGGALLGIVAVLALTADVVAPPPGKTQDEFAREMRGRNVMVVTSATHVAAASGAMRAAGISAGLMSGGLIYWALLGWRRRRWMSIPQDTTKSIEWILSDDELANYTSYGWPLRCAWCGWADNRVKAQDCGGIVFLCQICQKRNGVRRDGHRITVWQCSR